MIEAGAAGVHFEDQLASEKKCGHLGGKVLVPTGQFIRTLLAARLAADVLGVPTLLVARTDADAATLLTSDVDERDAEFLTGERTPEGFFRVRAGIEAAIARGLAYAPYADLVWWRRRRPTSARRASSPTRSTTSSRASCSRTTARRPSTGGATSTTTRSRASSASSARWATGSSSSRSPASTRSTSRCSSSRAATRPRACRAYVRLQEREFALEDDGYTATRHQREVGAGYFDEVAQRRLRRRELDARADGLDRGGAVRAKRRAALSLDCPGFRPGHVPKRGPSGSGSPRRTSRSRAEAALAHRPRALVVRA